MVTQAWVGDQRCLGVSRKPPEVVAGRLLDGLDGGFITSSQTRPCSIQAPHKQMNNHLKLLFSLGISANLHVCACACTHVHICVNMNMHLQVSMNVPHVNMHVINSSSSQSAHHHSRFSLESPYLIRTVALGSRQYCHSHFTDWETQVGC